MNEKKPLSNTDNTFLELLRAALHEERAELQDPIDWTGLFQLADRQHVLPLILESVWRHPGVPQELLSSMRFVAADTVIRQARRTISFLDLYRYLSDRQLYPLVLKGLICRCLYPQPDDRPSNDEDLLIKPAEFNAAHEALVSYGLRCSEAEPSSSMHEITYVGKNLRIELHLSCFPEDSEAYGDCNALFEGVHDRAVPFDTDGVRLQTLSPDDHILYLICHAYKHFLHSGVGIRQICDIAMFGDHYKTVLDWSSLRKKCDRIHIAGLTAAVFRITERYLGFTVPEEFADIEADETDLLKDILSGGIYGATEENRQHSSTITLAAVEAQKQGKKSAGTLSSLFPPLRSMEKKYPYLKKRSWLLPAAWAQRIFGYLSKKDRNTDPSESIRIGKERVELLRKYGILD